jgi:hypothetical protein
MKKIVMDWVVNPGIVLCFGTFIAVFSLGLVDMIIIYGFDGNSDLSGSITLTGGFLGYCCAAFALNIDFFERYVK